jgi:DNA-binding CsgD family transcriptional regulator
MNGHAQPTRLAGIAAEAFASSDLPALVLSLPSERIVAANPAAAGLLDPNGSSVIGCLFQAFTSDRATPGAGRLAGCLLDGGESLRVLRRHHRAGVSIRMWVRHIEGQSASRLVLVLLVPTLRNIDQLDEEASPSVLGIAGPDLAIDAISRDAEGMFGASVDDLLGRPLLELLTEADRDDCRTAWQEATARRTGVALAVEVRSLDASGDPAALECEILIMPLEPEPTCAFVLVPALGVRAPGPNRLRTSADLAPLLMRLARGAEMAHLAKSAFSGMSELELPGIDLLTGREREIVGRLVDGDRVPAIADHLYLAQSTIRNHLTSVFGKLGLKSQQELLNGLKAARSSRV